jgi:hypothetical protein
MLNKHFAIIASTIFLLLMFHPIVVKAQQQSVPYEIDVNLQPKAPPGDGEVVLNNYGDQENVKTEIDVWEKDLGKQATDGSYIGPLSESSIFEVDFTPLDENRPFQMGDGAANIYLNPEIDWSSIISVETWPMDSFFYFAEPDANNLITLKPSSFPVAKTRSIVSVTQIVNFSNRVIMSGATEFWVKIPVQSSCINFEELTPVISFTSLTTGEMFDETKLWLNGQHKISYSAMPSYTNWAEYINGGQALYPTQIGRIIKEFTGYNEIKFYYNGRMPQIAQPVTEKYIIGESIYAKVYATIEPNTDYIVTFSAIMKSKPKILLTEDDMYNSGRQSFIQTNDIIFGESSLEMSVDYYDSSIGETARPIVSVMTKQLYGTGGMYSPPINSTTELPVDMSFSFIFLSGRGANGMYGQHFNMKKDSSLVIYKTVTPTSANPYVSVMIPFISDKAIKINVTAEFIHPEGWWPGIATNNRFELQGHLYKNVNFTGTGIGNYTLDNVFGYKSPYWWQSESPQTYSDYILFTIPHKISTIFDDVVGNGAFYSRDIRIMITFVEEANLTFMFSTLSQTDLYSQVVLQLGRTYDLTFYLSSDVDTPSRLIRNKITYIYQNTVTQPIFFPGWRIKDDYNIVRADYDLRGVDIKNYVSNLNECEIVQAELFCSVQLTDGMWHQLVTNANGFQYATNFFERRMAVGMIEYYVDTTNRSTETQNQWYNDGTGKFNQAWECFKKGDLIGSVYNVIAGAVSLIWNGLKAFLGWIYGIFEVIWNTLCKVGQFIKTVLTNFVDTILSIIDDIVGNAEKILNIAIYIVSIIIFAYVVSWIGRFIYITKRGLNA